MISDQPCRTTASPHLGLNPIPETWESGDWVGDSPMATYDLAALNKPENRKGLSFPRLKFWRFCVVRPEHNDGDPFIDEHGCLPAPGCVRNRTPPT